MIRKISISLIGLLFSLQASAGFISFDWKTSGDNLMTLDTNTQLQWLDLTESNHLNFWEVFEELVGEGMEGRFPGFRYATAAEVEQLLGNFGLSQPYDGIFRSDIYEAANNFFSYLGTLSVEPWMHDIVVGRASEESDSTSGFSISACHSGPLYTCPAGNEPAPAHGTAYVQRRQIDLDSSGYVYANWLVRDVPLPVPVPAPLPLLLSGLFAIFLSRWVRVKNNKGG